MKIHNVYGVDLGTSAVKIYSQKQNLISIEKNLIAIRNGTEVIAVGNDAFEMLEKTPENIVIDSPVREGRIANVAEVEIVMRTLLRRIDHRIGRSPMIFYSAPVNMSEIEKRAYYAISHSGSMGNPKVYLIDRPICDAVALGIMLHRTRGSMIVNIGCQNTEISVVAAEQVIISRSIPIGGDQLSSAICDIVRREENLLIGMRTARRLKSVLATFAPSGDTLQARKVIGMGTLTGLPKESVITHACVTEAVRELLLVLADDIRDFLARVPREIGRCVEEEGIYLMGGTARIPGIAGFLAEKIGCSINLSQDYELCTVRGLEQIINNEELHKWAYTIRKKK